MYEITVLGSSSKGNCIYVDTGDVRFLLDSGLSLKQTKEKLWNLDVALSSINYIFVTHEHGDHIKSVKQLTEQYGIKVVSSRGTLRAIGIDSSSNTIQIKSGETLTFENLTIKAKDVNHDTSEPICFAFKNSMGEKLLYLTDCGMAKYLKFENFDIYIVEANYDQLILEDNYLTEKIHSSRYKRALSGIGHLSIDESIEFLKRNMGDKTKHIVLSHLSSENSSKEKFKNKATIELSFEAIDIAEDGLTIKFGDSPNIF